jgi:low affinity Fe/Cu permease
VTQPDRETEAPPAVAGADHESVFERVADWVSAAMGRPTNIIVWLVLVIGWTAAGPYLAQHPFLPAWSVSTGWNFPLNLVTTVAELFIGFLVAAASNRSERNLDRTLAAIAEQEKQIRVVENSLRADLASNTALTQQVHDLTAEVRRLLSEGGKPVTGSRTAPRGRQARTEDEAK